MRGHGLLVVLVLTGAGTAAAQTTDIQPQPPVVGKWNLTVTTPRGDHPAWVELYHSGYRSLVGRYVGRIGAPRPVGRAEWTAADSTVRFTIPPEWDTRADVQFEARLRGDTLTGTLTTSGGVAAPFTGRRAPALRRPVPTAWSAPRALLNGKDLTGWTPTRGGESHWAVRDGVLVNGKAEGANLRTVETFQDFQLHVEFRYPKRGDSGILLRGRYEVQIHDETPGDRTTHLTNGAVYGFLLPNDNATLGTDQWQSFDITLVGRRLTVVHNGKTVIADQIIPGTTGSALDADEAAPGPIVLQGEETVVEFRNMTISVPRTRPAAAPAAGGCQSADSATAVATVRSRLLEWVRLVEAGDTRGARDVWSAGVVGWFPSAPLFSDSAALSAAGLPASARPSEVRATFDVDIQDIVASGPVVVVHDRWTERREFVVRPAPKVAQRVIRGSELWRCEPDGRWRIVRYVSAPETWTIAP